MSAVAQDPPPSKRKRTESKTKARKRSQRKESAKAAEKTEAKASPAKETKRKRSASFPRRSEPQEPLPSMDAEQYARSKKIQSVHERMARLGWVLQHRVCEYLESIE